MRTLYLDCGMGAAGDMLTASLLQLFSEPVKQVKKLNDLKIPGVKYQLVACTRGGIRGYQVRVFVKGQEEENPHMQTEEQIGHKSEEPEKHTQEHGHHSMSQIVRLINRLKIEDQVKQDAVAVYKLIAKAEGKAESVIELLEELGMLPEKLKNRIMEENDLTLIKDWHIKAARAESIEGFIEGTNIDL